MSDRFGDMLNWSLIPVLVLAVAVTLTVQMGDSEQESERSKPPEYADYFIRGAKLSTLGINGKLLYQVQAREILHYPDKSAAISDMTLHYQGGDAGIWQIKAAKGQIPADKNRLELVGDVIIRGKRPNKGVTQMRMSEVVFLPEEGMMMTHAPVSITEPGSNITATGMEADILNDVISLSKDVQVRYAW